MAAFNNTFTNDYLQFLLVQPPFGYILQFTPQRAFLIFTNNTYNSNIRYGVYRPTIAMPGHFHRAGYAPVTLGRNAIINLQLQVGAEVLHLQIFEIQQIERGDMRPVLDLNLPLQPLDLNMPPLEEDNEQDDTMLELDPIHYLDEEVTIDLVLNILNVNHDPTYEEYLELEQQMGRVGSRLSEETIMQNMNATSYTANQSEGRDMCVICQDDFANDESIGGLQCGHRYHIPCITRWLQGVNKCPICNAVAV